MGISLLSKITNENSDKFMWKRNGIFKFEEQVKIVSHKNERRKENILKTLGVKLLSVHRSKWTG